MVAADPPAFGVLSQGERIAVALVLDRYDLLSSSWETMLEAVNRLRLEWTEAALRIQRNGWQEHQDCCTSNGPSTLHSAAAFVVVLIGPALGRRNTRAWRFPAIHL